MSAHLHCSCCVSATAAFLVAVAVNFAVSPVAVDNVEAVEWNMVARCLLLLIPSTPTIMALSSF